MHIIMDQIVRHDVEGKPVPELATSVTSSADGKTITFTLRKDVKFHDGTDFNAAAVKYHFDNMKYGKQQYGITSSQLQ